MKKITFDFLFVAATKTCYRFETGENAEKTTLYLKKKALDAIGINPQHGVTVTVEGNRDA